MATAKTSPTKSKTKNKPPPPAKPQAPSKRPALATPDEDDGGKLVRAYLAELPPLTGAQQTAFTRQCSNARADDFGARTRAINVLHDGERFARVIRGALDAPRGGLSYTKARFRFFLDALLALRAAIEVDTGKGRSHGKAQSSATEARERAGLARETLVERLGAYAEGEPTLTDALSLALGSTKDDDALLRSLASLIALARSWLEKTDAESAALAASVSLDEASVTEAVDARAALAAAHGDALGEGPRVVRDSPATNRAEGRTLFEMRYAMRLFEGAHGRDALSPRLVPGPGTRNALIRADRAEPPPPGGTTGAGGAAPKS